jgi:hypothetical protein
MRQMVAEGEIDFSVIEEPSGNAGTATDSAYDAERHAA